MGVRGRNFPKANEVSVFKTAIFNASAAVLQEMMYGNCLSFFCAQVYGLTDRICFLAIKLEQIIAVFFHSPRCLPEIPANLMARGCSHLRNKGTVSKFRGLGFTGV